MLNLELLLSSAGTAAVTKAEKPSLLNKVSIMSVTTEKVFARVKGTKHYSTSLSLVDNKVVRGSCNCMAFSSNNFCKHCVAVGLTVNAQHSNESQELTNDGSDLSADEQLISQYLSTLTKPSLEKMIMNLAVQEDSLYQQLLLKAQFTLNPPADKDIKKLITKALPNRQLWEYHKVEVYFNNAESSFKLILELIEAFPFDKQILFLEIFLERFNLVMAKVDDSYGARFGLESEIKRAFDTALRNVNWNIEQKGIWLFKHFSSEADIGLSVPSDGLKCTCSDYKHY